MLGPTESSHLHFCGIKLPFLQRSFPLYDFFMWATKNKNAFIEACSGMIWFWARSPPVRRNTHGVLFRIQRHQKVEDRSPVEYLGTLHVVNLYLYSCSYRCSYNTRVLALVHVMFMPCVAPPHIMYVIYLVCLKYRNPLLDACLACIFQDLSNGDKSNDAKRLWQHQPEAYVVSYT